MFQRTSRRAIARVAGARRLDGPPRALARVDGFDERSSPRVLRSRAPKRGRPSLRKCRPRDADVTAACGFRRQAQGCMCRSSSAPRLAPSNDENPAALLTLASGVAIAEAVRAVDRIARGDQVAERCVDRRPQARRHSRRGCRAGGRASVRRGRVRRESAAGRVSAASSRCASTSIEAETSRPADRALMLAEILAALGERYADLRAGRFDAILSAWRQLAPSLPGARVEWDSPAASFADARRTSTGTARCSCGSAAKVERVIAGEVRWLS